MNMHELDTQCTLAQYNIFYRFSIAWIKLTLFSNKTLYEMLCIIFWQLYSEELQPFLHIFRPLVLFNHEFRVCTRTFSLAYCLSFFHRSTCVIWLLLLLLLLLWAPRYCHNIHMGTRCSSLCGKIYVCVYTNIYSYGAKTTSTKNCDAVRDDACMCVCVSMCERAQFSVNVSTGTLRESTAYTGMPLCMPVRDRDELICLERDQHMCLSRVFIAASRCDGHTRDRFGHFICEFHWSFWNSYFIPGKSIEWRKKESIYGISIWSLINQNVYQ